jgi:hypothetical protein
MKINLMKHFFGKAASDDSGFEAKRRRASKSDMAERRRSLEAMEPEPEPEPEPGLVGEPLELAGEEPEELEEEDGGRNRVLGQIATKAAAGFEKAVEGLVS